MNIKIYFRISGSSDSSGDGGVGRVYRGRWRVEMGVW